MKKTLFGILILIFPVYAPIWAATPDTAAIEPGELEEFSAYTKYVGGQPPKDCKTIYLQKLSQGGKVYFLANRRDYQEALDALQRLPNSNSGSCLYVKAFCLEGLGKHQEAIQAYREAKSKIDFAFHPGFRFYLQSAAASMMAGNEKAALEDCAFARMKINESPAEQKEIEFVIPLIDKREIFVAELKGRYEEAFQRYLAIFNKKNDQFHLNIPLKADAATKEKAAVWMRGHSIAPENSNTEEIAKFYVTQGKAYLATGNLIAAKKSFEKAISVEPKVRSPLFSDGLMYDEHSPLTKIEEQARIILVRLYFNERNFKECCKFIRKLFARDPFDEMHMYNIISMHDVPQLVLQKDVDLHRARNERSLDFSDIVIFAPLEKQSKSYYDFSKDPQLTKALIEIEKSQFAACYDTLDQFLKTESAKVQKKHIGGYQDFTRAMMFETQFSHSVKLFQVAVAIGANKPNRGLSLFGGSYNFMSEQWLAVEDVLLGRRRRKVQANRTVGRNMSSRTFEAYCHFAAAVRAMSQKNFKQAAKEFNAVNPDLPTDGSKSELTTFANALKKYCEQQK